MNTGQKVSADGVNRSLRDESSCTGRAVEASGHQSPVTGHALASSHRSPITGHDVANTARGFFVTGTDTGVGKTLVSCALLHAYAQKGLRVAGMKPVAAGARLEHGRLVNDDVLAIAAAANVTAPHEAVNPYCFEPAIAPHLAAAEAGATIDFDRVKRAYRTLAALADCVIVEGAGGFRVPLGAGRDTADLAVELGLPVVMVVAMRLGCLNHALLTAQAVRAAGLPLRAWVANHTGPGVMMRADENVAALEERLGAPLLARIAYDSAIAAAPIARDLRIELLQ